MRRMLLAALLLPLAAGGCVRTAIGIATAPVRAAGKVVDWTTTSRAEADRNRGRKIRKAEMRERARAKRCRKTPDGDGCSPVTAGRSDQAR